MEHKSWGRAKHVGGDQYMVFEWFATQEECDKACADRKEELQTAVEFVSIYVPSK